MLLLAAPEVTISDSERARLTQFFRELAEQRRRENRVAAAAKRVLDRRAAKTKPVAKEALDETHDEAEDMQELEELACDILNTPIIPERERSGLPRNYGGLNFRRIRPLRIK